MIRVHVNASNVDTTDCNVAVLDVEPDADVQSVIWRAACLLDRGGRISVMVDYGQICEYASLADVPRPVLRVYWWVYTTSATGYEWHAKANSKDEALKAKAARLELWPDVTVTITRVTVRPKRAR